MSVLVPTVDKLYVTQAGVVTNPLCLLIDAIPFTVIDKEVCYEIGTVIEWHRKEMRHDNGARRKARMKLIAAFEKWQQEFNSQDGAASLEFHGGDLTPEDLALLR